MSCSAGYGQIAGTPMTFSFGPSVTNEAMVVAFVGASSMPWIPGVQVGFGAPHAANAFASFSDKTAFGMMGDSFAGKWYVKHCDRMKSGRPSAWHDPSLRRS